MTTNIEYHENTGKYYVVRNSIYQNFITQQNCEIFNMYPNFIDDHFKLYFCTTPSCFYYGFNFLFFQLIKINQPDLVLFVGEALVGNEAVDQLTKFNQALADHSNMTNPRLIDGIVLTKFDTIDDKVS